MASALDEMTGGVSPSSTAVTRRDKPSQPSTYDALDEMTDVQRKATPLEGLLTALGTTNYIAAGAADALTGGGDIRETVPRYLREHRDFVDLLRSRGANNWVALPAGFLLDVATDPLSYTGFGAVTKAGKLAKSAEFAARLAKVSGRAEDIAEATRLAQELAQAGYKPFVEGMGAQARAGHRSLVSVALPKPGGKLGVKLESTPIIRGAPVLDAMSRAAGGVRGVEAVGKARSLTESESELRGLDREVFKALKRRTAGEQALAVREVQARLGPQMTALQKAAKELGLEPEKVIDDLSDYIEGPILLSEGMGSRAAERLRDAYVSHPALEPLFQSIRAEHDDMMRSWVGKTRAAGVDITELAGLGYMRHKVRKEAADIIEKYGDDTMRGVSREVTEKHGAQLQRALSGAFDQSGNLVRDPDTGRYAIGLDEAGTAALSKKTGQPLHWRPLTRNEANKLAEAGELSVTGYHPVPGGLFEGPGVAAAFRGMEAAKSIGSAEMIRGYSQTAGMAENLKSITDKAARAAREVELVKQGWKRVPNKLSDVGDDVLFRPDIAAALSRHGEKIMPPDNRALKAIVEGYDQGLRAWKSYTLGLFPVFHTRNEIDDLFRAIGYGGMNPTRLADAAKITSWGTKAWRGGVEPVFRAGGRTWTASQIKKLLVQNGVVDTGQMSEALNKLGGMVKAKGFARVGDNAVVNAGKEVGRVRENWTRTALFLDGMRKGMSPAEAASNAAKFLFDYGDLSKFEQQVMRRLFPFYTYTRKNVPIQVEYLLRRPGMAAGVQKLRDATDEEGNLGLPGGVPLTSKLRESFPMRVGSNAQGDPQFLRLAGQLGVTDLNTLTPEGAFQRFQDLLSPAISTPLEMALNYDSYRGMPLEEYPGQSTRMLGVPVSSRWVAPVASTFRPLTELDRLLAIGKDYAVPSTGQRIGNLVFGRTYAQNVGDRAAGSAAAVEREVRRLQGQLRRAKSEGEVRKIIAAIQRAIEHPERLK